MTFRDMNLNVFRGESTPHVLFQPRIEPWYEWHRKFGVLPESYTGLRLPDLFDQLQISMRYVHYHTGVSSPIVCGYSPEVEIHERLGDRDGSRSYSTPYGDLVERLRQTQDLTWRVVDFAVKSTEDLRKLRWLYSQTVLTFSAESFLIGNSFVGQRGVPQFWVPRSPYQSLALQWMRLEDLVYALADDRAEVEHTMRVIDDSYDQLYEQITSDGRVQIVNFGENLHDRRLSPRYFERYLIPFYDKRANQLRQAGIFTHVHMDGYFRSLLRYLRDLPFDGLEALTPLPQGDVSLEEIREHIGEKVLLDGIPAVLFLPTYSREDLMETVERVVQLFHPRLILGVSDEVPEGAEEEAMTRVAMVSEWCRETGS